MILHLNKSTNKDRKKPSEKKLWRSLLQIQISKWLVHQIIEANLLISSIIFRQRFGLFSNPTSTAIGDNGQYKPVAKRTTADGEVITAPRNFYTTKMKVGKTDKELLKAPSYISIGDPFKMNNSKSMRTIIKDGHLKAGHEKAFFPAKIV